MDTVTVSVLGYIEDGCWVAHALEMDIVGVGETWEQAQAVLFENIEAQVSFAKYRGDDSLIFQPAPAHMFQKFREVREAELRGLVKPHDGLLDRFCSGGLGIPRDIPEGDYAVA